MKKLLILILMSAWFCSASWAQIIVDNTLSDEALVQTLGGNGVVITNVVVTAAPGAYGRFTSGNPAPVNIGIANGILLTSGSITGAVGPNNIGNTSTANGAPGSAILNALEVGTTIDATVIEFDITPSGNSLSFRYVFGSEEYHEYVNSQYNDVFGFFISGPGITNSPFNMALVDDGVPVSINIVNGGYTIECESPGVGENDFLFRDNCGGTSVQYDGFTKIMHAVTPTLIPCQTYHITLAIADVGDSGFDSGVFISAASFVSPGGTNFTNNINCNAGNWSVTATASDATVINNQWQLWATNVPGATTGGTLISTINGGLSATFNWLDLSRHYYIRHVSEVCTATETRIAVPNFSGNASASFNFEDENGAPKSVFCIGEDIYLDGTTSANYDRFYLSAGRRPAGSAPGTPFTGYGDYGWTIDNSIGILNLSDEFLNHGLNPGEVFVAGYEYEILLAIANPPNCIPWMELKKTFTVVCCDVNPAFTVQASCNNGNWSVTATAINPATTNHLWQLYEVTTPGATTGGTPVGPAQTTTNATFSGLNHSKFYYIKHSTGYEGCEKQMASVAAPSLQSNASLAYVFKDINNTVKNNFCYGEDIYLDPTGTSNYDRFFMAVYRRPIGGGNFSYYADYEWTLTNSIGLLNLSQLFFTSGQNPGEIFEPGYEYELQFAIANPPGCIPWTELKKRFTVECCDDFFSAGFRYDLRDKPAGFEVMVFDFNPYAPYATHEWTVVSSPNANGGPYTLVTQTTTTGAGPHILYSDGVSGLYYFVVHKVITLCGEYCYTERREAHNGEGSPDGGTGCDICGADDCSILEEIFCTAPGNLSINCYPAGVTIDWDPVPGVTNYWVQITYNDPTCCNNGKTPSTITYYTTYTYHVLYGVDRSCFSWRVAAICESGPAWSGARCFNGCEANPGGGSGGNGLSTPETGAVSASGLEKVLLYPNPANEQLNVLLPNGAMAETIRLLDMQGRVVFAKQVTEQHLVIDCTAFPSGLYTLQVVYPDRGMSVQKVQIINP